jgi:hypothetical protein
MPGMGTLRAYPRRFCSGHPRHTSSRATAIGVPLLGTGRLRAADRVRQRRHDVGQAADPLIRDRNSRLRYRRAQSAASTTDCVVSVDDRWPDASPSSVV